MDTEMFETKHVSLSSTDLNPCRGCWKCEDLHACWQEDDMEDILSALRWCDGLIIGSPVYFGLITGQLKIMMDRCIVMRPNYGDALPMSGKMGGAIACAASRNGGQETALQNIQTFFLQMNMCVISDGPRYCHAGGTIAGEARDDAWGLETVRNLAANMSGMLKARQR